MSSRIVVKCKSFLYRFLQKESLLDTLLLVCITCIVVGIYPLVTLTAETPSSGGDTGSHFWPLKLISEYGLFQGNVHLWNPGNLLGEPVLVHYFPLPFYIMYVLSWIMPIEIAFNVGTALPVVAFPLSVYFCLSTMRLHRPIPVLGAALSLLVLFNPAYSAWGGNLRSVLAGQFCHQYALVFLMLFLARFDYEQRQGKLFFGSALLASATCLSHAYVAIGLPIVVVGQLILRRKSQAKKHLQNIVLVGAWSFAMCLWWLWPSVDNNKWTTPYQDDWMRHLTTDDYLPLPLLICGLLLLLFAPIQFILSRFRLQHNREWNWYIVFFLGGAFFYAMVYVFPKIGLVDIRAWPQVYVFLALALAVAIGSAMSRIKNFWILAALVSLGVFSVFKVIETERRDMKNWTLWNYTGWSQKSPYTDLMRLSDALRGDFSDARVAYEHDPKNNQAGTERVFEMIPYFMQRSTLESLYMQSTLMARQVFNFQSLISDKPSCPLRGNPCDRPDFDKARIYMKMLAVKDLILSSELVIGLAEKADYLEKTGQYGMWHTYRNKDDIRYVSVHGKVELIGEERWRDGFIDWYYQKPDSALLVADRKLTGALRNQLKTEYESSSLEECTPDLKVEVNRLKLTTNCIGKPHLVRIAYHESWVASDDSPVLLASPGMMLVLPKSQEVTLDFGKKTTWRAAAWFSLVAFLLSLFLSWRRRFHKQR